MRTYPWKSIAILAVATLSLTACGSAEVKTGSLTQRFTMVDSEGRQFGVVELDPINGGSVIDVSGRVVGKITPPQPTTMAVANSIAPLPQTAYGDQPSF